MSEEPESPYLQAFRGRFSAALRWPQFDALWAALAAQPEGWYAYALGEPAPQTAPEPAAFGRLLDELAELLRQEHAEDYCGIVYADDLQAPTMVKVYDPNNLGMVCGSGAQPTLPGWVLSRLPPVDLPSALRPPAGRRRWWRRLLGA